MKIINWDKLRYRGMFVCGAGLTVSSTYQDTENFYIMEIDDADDAGNTLLKVTLEAKETEFFMTAFIVPSQITPNIKRVFRKKDMNDESEFLKQVCEELRKNSMVNSYLKFVAGLQGEKARKAFNSNSINLPF